jgi:protein-disulfide isomerase
MTNRMKLSLLHSKPNLSTKPVRNNLLKLIPRAIVLSCALSAAFLLTATVSHTQQGYAALKPPPGAHVALIEFADLQCPFCAHENSILKDAAQKYHIPWIRHDFLIPYHNWSSQAAIDARWFDAQPRHLGNEYRDAVFADQNNIETVSDLNQFTENFARQHGIALPFAIDPQGRFSNEVKADIALANSLGVHQTPTLWIVTDRTGGAAPYTQVTDFNKLFTMLDAITAQTAHARR